MAPNGQSVTASLISVADDDYSVRESLESLLRSVGFAVRVFASAEEFLGSPDLGRTDCLMLDVHMPGMGGIALRRLLKIQHPLMPVVFITAHGSEEEARSRASDEAAVDCLLKPLSEDEVLTAIHTSLTGS